MRIQRRRIRTVRRRLIDRDGYHDIAHCARQVLHLLIRLIHQVFFISGDVDDLAFPIRLPVLVHILDQISIGARTRHTSGRVAAGKEDVPLIDLLPDDTLTAGTAVIGPVLQIVIGGVRIAAVQIHNAVDTDFDVLRTVNRCEYL